MEQQQLTRRQERMALYHQVIALRRQGLSHQVIAERVGIGHSTVSNPLPAGAFPERKPADASFPP